MKLVALYKTWDGGEFVDASLASIYEHCDAIVMVHSEISWLGELGNTVRDRAKNWCCLNDQQGKVHHIDVNVTSQEQQYEAGINYIHQHRIPYDAVLAIDADEVWEDQYLVNAKAIMTKCIFPAYRCNMHTYLKTPFFKVDPPFGSPTVFLRDPKWLLKSPRGCSAPAVQLPDVWIHHYTYVRETRDDVERKLHQSCQADGGESVVPNWMEAVYDQLPSGESLHAFKRWRQVWQRVKKVWWDEVPPAMRTASLLPLWLPDGHLLQGELDALVRLCRGRRQAVDLGTYRGLSAVVLSLACERVHTIDGYEAAKGAYADTLDPKRYEQFNGHSLANTRALCDRFGNMTCEECDTIKAAHHWQGGPVDVLFVDADHSYEGTMGNVWAWLPHIPKDGLVILHDANTEIHPGVNQVVSELKNTMTPIDPGEFSGSLAAFRKST